MMTYALSLCRAARLICETEGTRVLLRRGFAFVLWHLFQYRVYYVYRRPLRDPKNLEGADALPRIDNFDFRIVESNCEADELEKCGLEFRSRILDARKKLEKGAIALVGFAANRLIHIRWVALDEQAQRALGEPPYRVDFASGEACYAGMWTDPQYRRRGLRSYARLRTFAFLRDRGFRVGKGIEARGNLAAQLSRSAAYEPQAEGRYLRILWWKSWRETPLTGDASNNRQDGESEYWNRVATRWGVHPGRNPLLTEHKRNTYLSLIQRWVDVREYHRILKTDLFDEAFEEAFLYGIAAANPRIVGLDVSREVVAQAKSKAEDRGMDGGSYICGNVKHLPIKAGCIGLVVSDSTLDHFPTDMEIVAALRELGRVLGTGGTLILSIDNSRNLTYPPYSLVRLWMRLGLAPYLIGRTLSLANLKQALERAGLSVEESTAIMHYPHPEALIQWLERFLSRLGRGRLDDAITRSLACLDRLEHRKTKYLTGRYIAVKAVKVR